MLLKPLFDNGEGFFTREIPDRKPTFLNLETNQAILSDKMFLFKYEREMIPGSYAE